MTPDFRELVGDEGTREELERLRRVHDLLVAAGPPAAGALPPAPAVQRARVLPLFRGARAQTALRLAAAACVAVAFGVGFLVGNQGEGFPTRLSVSMHGVGAAAAATAQVKVGSRDEHGNWPMLMKARGLPELRNGYFELFLTRDGKQHASCGTFSSGAGLTTIRLNAPYYSDDYGWVLVAHERGRADRVVLST